MVERVGFGGAEGGVIFFRGETDKVEVTGDEPWGVIWLCDRGEFV